MNKKLSSLVVILMFVWSVVPASVGGVGPAAHDNSAELQPEWSPAGQNVDYTVEICNVEDGGDDIDEVRIYNNPQYTNFDADDKTGWYKSPYNPVKGYYQYTALDSSQYIEEGECTVFTFSATTPPSGPEYCNLEWQFETRDTNDVWKFAYDTTSVDDEAPEIKKEVTGPQNLEKTGEPCPFGPAPGEECWVMDHVTKIDISVEDKGACQPPSGIEYCDFKIYLDGSLDSEWTAYPDQDGYIFENIVFEEDSLHVVDITCYDIAGNVENDVENFRVDSTPPETEKEYGTPSFPPNINDPAPYPHWVTTSTPITLDAVDPDPTGYGCNIGVYETWYLDLVVPNILCEDENECIPVCIYPELYSSTEMEVEVFNGGCGTSGTEDCNCVEAWELYEGPFTKDEESCHIIQYFSVDELGNLEDPMNVQCVFVDDTPPDGSKDVGTPNVPCRDDECLEFDYWVRDHETAITLTCIDPEPHPVDQEEVCYKVSLDYADVTDDYCDDGLDDDWCCVDDSAQIIFVEDSLHDLEYFCRDALGNANAVDLEYFRVDSQPPIITKTMIGTDHLAKVGTCPPTSSSDECYVRDDGANGVRIDVADDDTYGCAVDEVVCDYELWWETTLQSCIDEFGGTHLYNEGTGECFVEGGSFGEEGKNILFNQDSTHSLTIHCEDALGNPVDDEEEFLVDSTPPETTKTYGTPTTVVDGYRWITGTTPITLTAVDEKVGVEGISYRVTYVGDYLCPEDCCETGSGTWTDVSADTTQFTIPQESCHFIEFKSIDLLGNEEALQSQCVMVDNTAPQGIKEVGDPNIPCTTTTTTTTTTTIPPTTTTIPPTTTTIPPTTTTMPTTTTTSSTTTTTMPDWCYGVPNPEACNVYSPEQCEALSPIGCYWCTSTTMCWGTPVACELIPDYWSYDPVGKCMETSGCYWGQPGVTSATAEDRQGDVQYVSEFSTLGVGDGPCASATQDEQCAYVPSDSLPPYAYDTLVAQGTDPSLLASGCGDILILSSGYPLNMGTLLSDSRNNVGCGANCQPDGTNCELNPDGKTTYDCVDLDYMPTGDSVMVAASSEWPEYYESLFTDWMRIGGIVDISINDWEPDVNPDDGWPDSPYQDVVDLPLYTPSITGTVTLATIAEGQEVELRIADSGDHIYDTIMIVVPLSCFEEEPEPILCGNDVIDPGEECEDDSDCAPGEVCETCLCVEGGEPEEPGCDYWVRDHVTEITLDCEDQGPHPVEQETLCYRVSFDDPQTPWLTSQYCSQFGGTMEGDWCCVYVGGDDLCAGDVDTEGCGDNEYTITFQEDSLHDLEFYCKDHLGNTESPADKEWFKVDSTAPTTEKIITPDPYYDGDVEYIDTAHEITLTATDGGPICAIGVDKIYWANSIVPDEACLNPGELCNPVETCYNEVEGNSVVIQKVDESCHLLQYYAVDELGNTEEVKTNCFFVDKQKPVTSKVYGDPYFEENGVEWINSETEVNLSAYDPEPHPSGVAETLYRDIYLEDEADWHYCYEDCETWQPCVMEVDAGGGGGGGGACPAWQEYTGPFNKEPESCHIIEFYSVDNVGKEEQIQWQCVFVDNSPPDPVKTVGDPKTKWDGTDSTFYPEETAHCWDGTEDQIECWKVTLDTPITLDCVDPEPHPVDHEITCFMVGLDGDDATAEYCSEVGGDYNESGDGYCCGQNAPFEFYFMEETEHNLKYYCEDALGNKGPVDEEKFKVFGESFEIQINKKWNLVSVPFVLLNNDIEEVFDSISENIATVWTYDAATDQWYVYRPGEPNNNLGEINTGWGYWVEALEDDWLLIGGDLFMPAVLPPSRDLKEGWNLIGYYGTEGQIGYYGPDGNGKPAYCALYSLVDINLVPKWNSLLTYWEPDNPYQWKEYGIILDNNLDPGAGYWIHLKEDGNYAPSTACVPIFD